MRGTALRIGLTGGIGSGKSTVARTLVACGAALVDADAISRAVTAAGGAAIPEIAAQFGSHLVAADGAMDRERMRQLAFDDPGARRRLESIVHPLVGLETLRQYEQAAGAGKRCVVFDIPLLVESGRWRQQLDQVLVVDCSEATQIDRVMARNGWPRDVVEKILAGQASRSQRVAAADICLYNDGVSLDALDAEVRRLAGRFGL
ncbi:dephospho-CoA kinase [Polaromonas sp. YR568]|uniref:dephospho-CoA kinase n=1 Tax=Polaromonas sp. YR568 TaxID=1855301 RepID=UPI0008F1BA74|nr:dephospho-CoA kinase [Polaromonas sp. YR568]SFU63850.1 dephospho-CoA kinase [Polaromonas sp. YR568]